MVFDRWLPFVGGSFELRVESTGQCRSISCRRCIGVIGVSTWNVQDHLEETKRFRKAGLNARVRNTIDSRNFLRHYKLFFEVGN